VQSFAAAFSVISWTIERRWAISNILRKIPPGPGGHDAEWKTAAMFFENRGGIGNKSSGYIIKQMVVGVSAIINS